MADAVSVALFVEDRAHELFLTPVIRRLAREAGTGVTIRLYSARGGHNRALEELRTFQRLLEKGVLGLQEPDVFVVGIDANCAPHSKVRQEIAGSLTPALRGRTAIACADPHVERWFMADPASFEQALGRRPKLGKRKCERDRYKDILARTVKEAGYPAMLGGLEFADDIAAAMDLYRAGKNEKSLKAFIDTAKRLLARRDRD